MMVFCGSDATASQYGKGRTSKSNSASALIPAYPADDSVKSAHSPARKLAPPSFRRPA